MNNRIVFSSCAAAILSLSMAAAQTTTQTPTQSPVQSSTQGITGQTRVGTDTKTATQVTVTGCVVRESEYTNARGGVLGTGVGAGNEFVLANVTPATAGATASAQIAGGVSGSTSAGNQPAAPGASGTAIGTSGTASTAARTMSSYSLTGNREADLAQHVGKRVEIVGTVDSNARGANATAGASAAGTGATAGAGASAQRPAAAAMQELSIVSFRPVEGSCP